MEHAQPINESKTALFFRVRADVCPKKSLTLPTLLEMAVLRPQSYIGGARVDIELRSIRLTTREFGLLAAMFLPSSTYENPRKDEAKMNRGASILLVVFLVGVAGTQIQQRELLSGRYYTPSRLRAQLEKADTELGGQYYLVGAYDLTQDTGKSCAMRNTTTAVLLEKVFSDYLQAHPELMQSDRTAAGVAAQAFAEYWPCKPKPQ